MLSKTAPLSDWLAWLETLSPIEIDLGLERVQEVLQRLDLAMPRHLLLIAGTNGKGSSVLMADAILRATGKTVGSYTSPHIIRFNERIVVGGEAVNDRRITTAFARVDAHRRDTRLTYFEFSTLAAAVIFAEAGVDVWVLEIGLGGRLDACNVFEPSASLITNVSLDHCDWLGDDVESIAAEKAGVMRAGRPTVFGGTAVPATIVTEAEKCGAKLLRSGEDFCVETGEDGTWSWHSPNDRYTSLLPPGLSGDFQILNAAAVLMLLNAAEIGDSIDTDLLNQVLPPLKLQGRMQNRIEGSRQWLFDVAHNPAAAAMLATNLAQQDFSARTIAIIGVLANKDVDGVIGPLVPHVDEWIAVTATNPRALSAGELARQLANLSNQSVLIADSIQDAIEFARRRTAENDRILVTGSFFTVGPVIEWLDNSCKSEDDG